MSKILFFFLSFVLVNSQYRYDCDDTYCSRNDCSQRCSAAHRLLENATPCGCCHLCLQQLKEGEKCESQEFAALPKKECGPRLHCDSEKALCLPAKTVCMIDLAEYEKKAKDMTIRPDCDEFGFYKPVQCIPDIMCYCVTKEGKRIFGTDIASRNASMKCDCSREYEEFPRKLATGEFLRCMSNGNYDEIQCTEKGCYCTGSAIETNIRKCYGEKSRCLRERETLLRQMAEHEKDGRSVVGVDLPDCELDGSYSPVKCEKGSCYCVKKNGEQYGRTKYKRNHTKVMEYCRCLRDAEVISSSMNKNRASFLKKNACEFKEEEI